MDNWLLWVKAFHVVADIAWMAGVLYLYRLLVYHKAETEAVVKQRLEVWERKLINAITRPAMVVAWLLGLILIWQQPYLLALPWMRAKLALAVLLTGATQMAIRYHRKLAGDKPVPGEKALRFLNEVPTLLMIGIVILVIVRPG
ncbi:MAG: CopD family protein [Candidatus Sericytochromatia bacterium]|uniref:Protoporphyrinogen IX oxidase n=1 Tax=Candidatus Tanganyikabacteria bacterium TaxID=2961651 RepID=A0A938BLT1_9BACT|nr:CopD family protein [Candidatus Tanganyikabacteria bacterium]